MFNDTNAAKQALKNGQIDAIVVDLPTAFYITAAEIPKAHDRRQFQPTTGEPEQFGLLLDKGTRWSPCVNQALDAAAEDGTLGRARAAVARRRRRTPAQVTRPQ